MRLFVAIDLPDDIVRRLEAIQPRNVTGIRPTKPPQMHLTLHFLGESDLDEVAAALHEVRGEPFAIQLHGVDFFPPNGSPTVLWAGIAPSESLRALHEDTGTALANAGFELETRPWHPHVTLARCRPNAPQRPIEAFLQENADLAMDTIAVHAFHIYSSEMLPDGPVYRREETFLLE